MKALATVALLVLAGCATAPPPAGTVRYRCEDGRMLTAVWQTEPRRVTITAGGMTETLDDAVMMSSVDYFAVRGDWPLRLNGSETLISQLSGFPERPYRQCRKV
jgi:hypothetical protein